MRTFLGSLFVLVGGPLLAQQQWVPLASSGVVGVVAPDSPLPPLFITPFYAGIGVVLARLGKRLGALLARQ